MGERVGATEEAASLLFGPGGVWRLSSGQMTRSSSIPDGRVRFMSALLELPAPLPLERLFAARNGLFRPAPRWAGADAGGGPVAVPLVVELPDIDLRRFAMGDLIGILEGALRELVPGFRRGEPGFRLRLGSPLPAAIVALDQQRSDRRWEPDAAVANDAPLGIVAVIDDGLPFAHSALRDGAGRSRVEFCWLQGEARQPDDPWPAGGSVPTGREFFRGDIDALIAAHGDDEDVLYETAGVTAGEFGFYGSPLRRMVSHGSHVLGAAAAATTEGELRFIGVQLAQPFTLDTSGESRWQDVVAAVHYVLERADRIAAGYGRPSLPLVINLSYGYTGGPHDGSGLIARRLRALVDARVAAGAPTLLTLPAGNSFQDALNGRIALPADGAALSCEVPWRLPANDRTPTRLELWFAQGADLSVLDMAVIDPLGAVNAIAVGEFADPKALYVLRDGRGTAVGRVWREPDTARPCLVVALEPTEAPDGSIEAVAGRWIVRLRADPAGALAGPVDIGIQRDFDPLGYRRGGRQSRLDPDEPRLDEAGVSVEEDVPGALITRFGSLNDLVTDAPHTVAVAGFVAVSGEPAPYSSAGRPMRRRDCPSTARLLLTRGRRCPECRGTERAAAFASGCPERASRRPRSRTSLPPPF